MKIISQILIEDKYQLQLVDWSDKGAGLYCRDLNDKVLWFIPNEPNNPFTSLFISNKRVEVVKWDGSAYIINVKTGYLMPFELLK